jgi:hypothetical protein
MNPNTWFFLVFFIMCVVLVVFYTNKIETMQRESMKVARDIRLLVHDAHVMVSTYDTLLSLHAAYELLDGTWRCTHCCMDPVGHWTQTCELSHQHDQDIDHRCPTVQLISEEMTMGVRKNRSMT